MAKKKVIDMSTAEVTVTPTKENTTAWNTVCNAAIDYIEPKANNDWFTAEDILDNIIKSGKCGPMAVDAVEGIIADMLLLFVGNHILIQQDNKYRKFTLEEAFPNGIEIEAAQNNGKKKKEPTDI